MDKQTLRHECTSSRMRNVRPQRRKSIHHTATCVNDRHRRPSKKTICIAFTNMSSPFFALKRLSRLLSDPGVTAYQRSQPTTLGQAAHSLCNSRTQDKYSTEPRPTFTFLAVLTWHDHAHCYRFCKYNRQGPSLRLPFAIRRIAPVQQRCSAPSDYSHQAATTPHHALRLFFLQPIFIPL